MLERHQLQGQTPDCSEYSNPQQCRGCGAAAANSQGPVIRGGTHEPPAHGFGQQTNRTQPRVVDCGQRMVGTGLSNDCQLSLNMSMDMTHAGEVTFDKVPRKNRKN